MNKLLRWRPGRLARNTAHASLWNGLRIVLQGLSLVMLARLLGAQGYGALAGAVAIFVTFAQLVGAGTGYALVRHVARGGVSRTKLVAVQRVFAWTGALLFAAAWPLSYLILGDKVPAAALAALALAELVFAPAMMPLVFRYMAEERLGTAGAVQTLAPAARLAATVVAFLFGFTTLLAFSVAYLVSLAVVATASMIALWPRGGPQERPEPLLQTAREGLPFVIGGVATTAGGELDKTVILRDVGSILAGQYTAAYRVVQAATLPINSLVLAVMPRLFRTAPGTSRITRPLVVVSATYAALAALVLWIAAPILPVLLGSDFAKSVPLLRAMCPLLVTSSVRQILSAQLTGFDSQATRNWIEGASAIGALTGFVILVPRFGAAGAIGVNIVADILVAIAAFATIRRMRRPAVAAERPPNFV